MANTFEPISSPQLPLIVKHLRIFRWGCTPLQLESNSFYRISTFLLFVSIFWVIVALYAGIFSYMIAKQVGPFTDVLEMAECIIILTFLPLHMFWMIWNRFNFDKTVKRLIALQRVLGAMEYKMFYAIKFYILSSILLAAIFVLNAPIYISFTHREETTALSPIVLWIVVLSTYISIMCRVLSLCFFTYLVCCVRACFSQLSLTVFVGKTDVKRFVRTYSHLVDVSSEISEYFDPTASAMLLFSFLHLVKLSSIFMSSHKLTVPEGIILYLGLGLVGMGMMHIILVCHSATEEADSCSKVLVNYVMYSKHDPDYNDPYAMLHMCVKKTVTFRICKSLSINYNLVVKMITAYLTYTIVLFQTDISTSVTLPDGNNTANASAI